MIKTRRKKFRKGAASFYIVAISTLILVVLATSFAAVMISEMARTSNDDLSQSAYDAALAGVEDAKLAYYNYRSCMELGSSYSDIKPSGNDPVTCQDIMYWMNHPDCDMVAHILGRIGKGENSEVLIEESMSGSNNMQQAYTCNKITTKLKSYLSTLNQSNMTRVVHAKFDGVSANEITKVKVSWYSNTDGAELAWTNFSSSGVVFPQLRANTEKSRAATPPTISVGLVQTGSVFSMEEFEKTDEGTNRGTVYLVPVSKSSEATRSQDDAYIDDKQGNYIGAWDGNENVISASQIVKSNNHTVKNLPFAVYCNPSGDFVCSAYLELPRVYDGEARNDETFMFVISIPYGQPSTDFSLEFFCADGSICGTKTDGDATGDMTTQATLSDVQVNIDSTGRANNLYRRVEARLDTGTAYFPYPLYAIELLDTNSPSQSLLTKPFPVTSEYNF